jgi:2'-phosphotransferase
MSCSGIILIDNDKILLVKNSKGRWSFPKGKKENLDLDDYSCARREFNEETGLVGFTYSFNSTPYIEMTEKGTKSCILYIAKVINKHSDYGFIEGHTDIDSGDIIESKFMNIDQIRRLSDREFYERRKNIARDVLMMTNSNILSYDRNDVMLKEWKKTNFSKAMSKLLRHSLDKFNSKQSDGSVLIEELLNKLESTETKNINLEIIKHIVRNCLKQRFQINSDKTRIRCVQGHSSEIIDSNNLATLIKEPIENVVHMSYINIIKDIKKTGLSKMKRTHIHFAEVSDSILLRKGCNLEIGINMNTAMADGIQFFRAENKVIISPGNKDGFIPFKHLTLRFI